MHNINHNQPFFETFSPIKPEENLPASVIEDKVLKIFVTRSERDFNGTPWPDREGTFIQPEDYHFVISNNPTLVEEGKETIVGDVDLVEFETNRVIARFRGNMIGKDKVSDEELKELTNAAERLAHNQVDSRGSASGPFDLEKMQEHYKKIGSDAIITTTASNVRGKRSYPRNPNGIVIGNYVYSPTFGYYFQPARNPDCRLTSYSTNTVAHRADFAKLLSFIGRVDECYKKLMPDAHKNQWKAAHDSRYLPATAIELSKQEVNGQPAEHTAFSTFTLNGDFPTAVHKDSGDLPDGFGNLTTFNPGTYTGGYTILPEYRDHKGRVFGFNVKSRDFLAMDVHSWHGNAPLKDVSKGAEGFFGRVSCVCYLRENLRLCPSNISQEDVKKTINETNSIDDLMKIKTVALESLKRALSDDSKKPRAAPRPVKIIKLAHKPDHNISLDDVDKAIDEMGEEDLNKIREVVLAGLKRQEL